MIYLEKEKYLEYIVEKYSNMIYRLALSRTKLKEEAEDVYQDVLFKLSEKIPKFESEEHEKAWLIRVTVNFSKNYLNSAWNRHRTELEEISFETQERHEVYYAVLKLPLKYRTIIYLFYYENYKVNEISKILKINQNTVKTRLSRAREKLKFDMEEGEKSE